MTKAEYMTVYNAEHFIDGTHYNTFEEARDAAYTILAEWVFDGMHILDKENYSEDALEGWNEMIEECWVAVYKYNPDTNEYEEFWEPSDEDYESVGWFPINALMLTPLNKLSAEAEKFEEFSDSDVSID